MKYISWIHRLLFIILFLSILLRTYKLGEIPNSLNPDEVALGYNAYSLLKTGADEHGAFLPLSLASFGDWKLPGYPYVAIPFIAFLGLSEIAVRLPSVLAGIISVLLIYHIASLLFKKKQVGLFAALFFAISPWSIYFSRAAYEVNLAIAFFLGGVLSFLAKKPLLASIFFCLAFFTYHAYAIFIPLFVVGLYIIYRHNLTKSKGLFVAGILLALAFVIFNITTLKGGSNKITTLNIFSDENIIYNRVERLRGDGASKNITFEKFFHNKYLGVSYQLTQNYLAAYSPSFLFDKGGEKLVHNLGFFGNLYLFDALLIFIGLASLFWAKDTSLPFLLLWFIAGPIPSIITKDTPNSARLFLLMPLFVLITSYGAYQLLVYLKKKTLHNYFLKILLISLFILNVAFFLEIYFVHFAIQRARFWDYGYKQAVMLAQKYPQDKVVMTGPENFPYIYFLFYERYDPKKFRSEVEYYPPTSEGFYFVKKFGRFQFVDKIKYEQVEPNTIYIDSTRLDDKNHTIFLPNGDAIFGYYISDKKETR